MCKKLLVFGAGTLMGATLAKWCILLGMAINEVEHRRSKASESKTTEQES